MACNGSTGSGSNVELPEEAAARTLRLKVCVPINDPVRKTHRGHGGGFAPQAGWLNDIDNEIGPNITKIDTRYRVEEWEVTDAVGHVVHPDSMRWDEDNLIFTATRWELLKASLVTVPADAGAGIRAHQGGFDRALVVADLSEGVQVLMLARMRMDARQRMYDRQEALFA